MRKTIAHATFAAMLCLLVIGMGLECSAREQEQHSFEEAVKPFLVKHGYDCHGGDEPKLSSIRRNELRTLRQTKLRTAEEETMWQRGASNADYHYLGCSKVSAQEYETFQAFKKEHQKDWEKALRQLVQRSPADDLLKAAIEK